MTEKDSRNVPMQGADSKGVIALTLYETLHGETLLFQIIFTGTTTHSLPAADFPEGFHLNNKNETFHLLRNFISP